MDNGWIKLHRKTLDNEIWQHDKTAWCLFQTLLLIVDSKSGTWEGGRFQLCSAYGDIHPSTLYKALLRLEQHHMVTLSSNTRYSKIHICKWGDYQYNGNTKREQPSNNRVTTNEQQSNTLTRSKNKELRIKNNSTNVELAKPKIYGNPDINELFLYWEKTTGLPIKSKVQQNRNACSNLIKRHGAEALKKLIDGVAMSQVDKFAPRIADFVSLQAKTNELLLWGKQQTNQGRVIIA